MGEEKRMEKILITCLLGIGTEFVGLICIILLVELMHYVMNRKADGNASANEAHAPAAPAPVASANAPIANRGEVVAAISAAIAEDLGKDAKAIRITSIKGI